MEHLGATFGVLKKEKCTGDPARRLGNDLVFQQLAEQNLETLTQAKVTKIVSICPHCVRTISTDWKEFGEAPADRASQRVHGAPSGPASAAHQTNDKIVYHDPCYLGRYRGIYDEPRDVLALSGEVIDPPRSRERSFCCGAGGGLAFLGEETGERVSHNRAQELVATGAERRRRRLPLLQHDVPRRACSRHQTPRRSSSTSPKSPPPRFRNEDILEGDANHRYPRARRTAGPSRA